MSATPPSTGSTLPPGTGLYLEPPARVDTQCHAYFLCLHFPHLGAQVLAAKNESLFGKAFATTLQDPGYARARVASVSPKCPRDIAPGMPVREAKRLAPQMPVFHESPEVNNAFKKSVLHVVKGYAPRGLWLSPQALCLELSGTQRLYGPRLHQLGREISELLGRTLKLESITAGSAHRRLTSLFCALVSETGRHLYCPPKQDSHFLGPLSLEALPCLSKKGKVALTRLNILTFADCQSLSLQELHNILGNEGKKLYYLIRDDADLFTRNSSHRNGLPRQLTQRRDFTTDLIEHSQLQREVKVLAEQLASRLRKHGAQAGRLHLTLHYTDGNLGKASQPPDPAAPLAADFPDVLKSAYRLLDAAHNRRVALRRADLKATHLRVDTQQTDMFANETRTLKLKALGRSLDHIREKYRFESVMNGDLV